ncbi:MAG: YibE/F family protein [Candidatus Paceibacterota bacterium]
MTSRITVLFLLAFGLLPVAFFAFTVPAGAQEGLQEGLHTDYQGTWSGKVLEVVSEERREIPGTDTEHLFQMIRAEILDGPREGEIITFENDYLELSRGDKFFFNHNVSINGNESYGVVSINRISSLIWLAVIFVLAVVVFGGWQGVRSLIALIGSFLVILYVLLPGLLNGWDPLLASILVASGILFAAVFFTHGFNRESVVAYAGTMIAVLLTGVFAYFSVHAANLTGFAAEESVYLNFNTGGTLNFTGLLLGAIIIGVLGVLDDIAVTQAAVVNELYRSNREMTRREAYKRAIRVGREHVGALVNTLVLAYTGVSLPLLLYFYLSPVSFGAAVNSELFATEIVRIVAGSLGLILTVPIVTLLAVLYLKGENASGHSHGHSHGHAHAGH